MKKRFVGIWPPTGGVPGGHTSGLAQAGESAPRQCRRDGQSKPLSLTNPQRQSPGRSERQLQG